MAAATKKKRGRPSIYRSELYSIYSDKEKRVAQNMFYAGHTICMLNQKPGGFFVTEKGALRRQGIAEQIGRMVLQDGYSDDEASYIADVAMQLFQKGYSVKVIERWIRKCRITGEW